MDVNPEELKQILSEVGDVTDVNEAEAAAFAANLAAKGTQHINFNLQPKTKRGPRPSSTRTPTVPLTTTTPSPYSSASSASSSYSSSLQQQQQQPSTPSNYFAAYDSTPPSTFSNANYYAAYDPTPPPSSSSSVQPSNTPTPTSKTSATAKATRRANRGGRTISWETEAAAGFLTASDPSNAPTYASPYAPSSTFTHPTYNTTTPTTTYTPTPSSSSSSSSPSSYTPTTSYVPAPSYTTPTPAYASTPSTYTTTTPVSTYTPTPTSYNTTPTSTYTPTSSYTPTPTAKSAYAPSVPPKPTPNYVPTSSSRANFTSTTSSQDYSYPEEEEEESSTNLPLSLDDLQTILREVDDVDDLADDDVTEITKRILAGLDSQNDGVSALKSKAESSAQKSILSQLEEEELNPTASSTLPTLESLGLPARNIPAALSTTIRASPSFSSLPTVGGGTGGVVGGAEASKNVVLLPEVLQKVSETLSKEGLRRDAGSPTALAVATGAALIAVGTTHGLVLVFDHQQKMQIILGTNTGSAESQDNGPVTALDIAPSNDWIAVGHQNGNLVLWDVSGGAGSGGKIVKTITDSHKGSPINFLRFVKDRSHIVSADQRGEMFQFNVSRVVFMSYYVVETIQILSAASGSPILAFSVLSPSQLPAGTPPHPSDSYGFVAFATDKRVVVVSLFPKLRVVFKTMFEEVAGASFLPSLTWRTVVSVEEAQGVPQGQEVFQRKSSSKAVSPILAITWKKHIQLFQVYLPTPKTTTSSTTDANGPEPEFIAMCKYETDVELTGMEWLGSQMLLLLNSRDQLRAFDPFGLQELESQQIKQMELVYHISRPASLSGSSLPPPPPPPRSSASGSPAISPASHSQLPLLGSTPSVLASMHNCMKSGNNSKVYLLGLRHMYVCNILPWHARISALVDTNKWLEALSLSLDFYEERAKVAVGLPQDAAEARKIIAAKIEEILLKYLNLQFNSGPPSSIPNSTYQTVGMVCIDHCLRIGRESLLFVDIFNRYRERAQEKTFLELLEPFILSDRLTSLNPELIQAFVHHYSSSKNKGMLKRVEQCILHLDILCLDFHQVVTLCRKHHLSSALIYVYNKGLEDYITPLEDLMNVISSPSSNNKTGDDVWEDEERRKIAYKMMLYIKYCLAGQAWPRGKLPSSKLPDIKIQILNFLFVLGLPNDPFPYPRLYRFLRMDSKEFLQVLGVAFDDLTFTSTASSPPTASANNHGSSTRGLDHQSMLKVLVALLVDPSVHPFAPSVPSSKHYWPFTLDDTGQLFMFAAKYYAKGVVQLSQDLFNRVIGYLTRCSQDSISSTTIPTSTTNTPTHKEREEHMLEVLRVYPQASLDEDRVLRLAEGAEFQKVAKFLHLRKGNYSAAILCQLRGDAEMKEDVFNFIRGLLLQKTDDVKSNSRKAMIEEATLKHLERLIEISSTETSLLILEFFADQHAKVIQRLERKYPKLLFEYLQAIMEPANITISKNTPSSGKSVKVPTRVFASMGELLEKHGVVITGEMQETYIKLMCEFGPERVYRYLVSHDDYRLDHCLQLVKTHQIADATAYLLERTGDVPGALDLILRSVDQKMTTLTNALTNPSNVNASGFLKRLEQEVEQVVNVAIALCQRTSPTLEPRESEVLWFRLLDKLVHPLRKLKFKGNRKRDLLSSIQSQANNNTPSTQGHSRKVKDVLTSILQMVLGSVMGYVSLPSLLFKIVDDHGSDEFSEFRSVILNMLDTFSYEKSIMDTANGLFQNDIHNALNGLVTLRKKAITTPKTRNALCSICSTSLFGGAPLNAIAASNKEKGLQIEELQRQRAEAEILFFPCGHSYHSSCLSLPENLMKICLICQQRSAEKVQSFDVNQSKRKSTALVLSTNNPRSDHREESRLTMFQNLQASRTAGLLYKQPGGSRPPPLPQKKIVNARVPGSLPQKATYRGGIPDDQFALVFKFR